MLAVSFYLAGCKVSAQAAVKFIAARFGDDLYDAASRLSILRFEPSRLHLHFFYEGKVDAGGERTIHARVNADAAEAAIGDADAVSDVVVFESGAAGDGRISCAGSAATGHARSCVEQAGNA